MNTTRNRTRVLHITNWFPNPWNVVEGNFIRDQIEVFSQISDARTAHVQVREDTSLFRVRTVAIGDHARGYYILVRSVRGRIMEWLTTLLLIAVLLRERAWRFDVLHFHIAYPLLVHVRIWRWLFRKPIIISDHWSAYHFNFYLPVTSPALPKLRKPFKHGFPVIGVSRALLADIRVFSENAPFAGYVIPNVVPLHGHSQKANAVPILFAVNRWVDIKDPMPMLRGLAGALGRGADFELVIGGFGEALLDEMKEFVRSSALAERTRFLGQMSKAEIARQLAVSDGYLFSSRYETFSIACAEALGAGVPLLGPSILAITEYSGPENWQTVEARTPEGWTDATMAFLEKMRSGYFDGPRIASRAADRFSVELIRSAYSEVLERYVIGKR